MLWDARVEKLLKRGGRRVDEAEVAWKPMHVVHLLNIHGGRCGRLKGGSWLLGAAREGNRGG
jgi:hypothetical protein